MICGVCNMCMHVHIYNIYILYCNTHSPFLFCVCVCVSERRSKVVGMVHSWRSRRGDHSSLTTPPHNTRPRSRGPVHRNSLRLIIPPPQVTFDPREQSHSASVGNRLTVSRDQRSSSFSISSTAPVGSSLERHSFDVASTSRTRRRSFVLPRQLAGAAGRHTPSG